MANGGIIGPPNTVVPQQCVAENIVPIIEGDKNAKMIKSIWSKK